MDRGILQNIYLKLPSLFQNMFLTIYGYKLKRIRYGQHFRERLSFLEESQYWSYEKIKRYQDTRLQSLINYVYDYIPYYKEAMHSAKIKPDDIRTQEDLSKFPVIKKIDVIKNYQKFQTTHPAFKDKNVVEIETSGSTGTPLKIRLANSAFQYDYANNWRQRRWNGVNIGDRIASFNGRVIIDPNKNHGKLWRKNYSFNQTFFSLHHLNNETINRYVNYLLNTDFDYFNGYPSSIVLLADFIHENKINYKSRSLKYIHTSSETLYDIHRERIEKAFKTKISDRYSNAESVCSLAECKKGRYHLNAEDSILEVINIKNNIGKMICTGLNNYVMPLIRYDIGDLIEQDSVTCSCGLQTPSFKRIIGREDDVIKTPDGKFIGRLDHIYKGLKHIKRAQIVQDRIDGIIFRIEIFDDFNEQDEENLYKNARLRLGKDMKIKIEKVDYIESTRSGKFKAVINHLKERS